MHKYRGDHEQSVIGASSSELGPSARGRPRSGNDLGEVEVSVWWNVAPKRDVFGTEVAPGWPGVRKAPEWTLGVVDLSGGSTW